jgi:hypothetical protein
MEKFVALIRDEGTFDLICKIFLPSFPRMVGNLSSGMDMMITLHTSPDWLLFSMTVMFCKK